MTLSEIQNQEKVRDSNYRCTFNSSKKKGMVLAYKFEDKRFDCGSIDGFIKATNYFYDKSIKDEKNKKKKITVKNNEK